mmetsp:Transcript_15752/g.59724  ORF Transcript_15752/g.59724 Transcript_15752/m.59724 type:complete len:336 (+) Transcript_15752:709-1716(+)
MGGRPHAADRPAAAAGPSANTAELLLERAERSLQGLLMAMCSVAAAAGARGGATDCACTEGRRLSDRAPAMQAGMWPVSRLRAPAMARDAASTHSCTPRCPNMPVRRPSAVSALMCPSAASTRLRIRSGSRRPVDRACSDSSSDWSCHSCSSAAQNRGCWYPRLECGSKCSTAMPLSSGRASRFAVSSRRHVVPAPQSSTRRRTQWASPPSVAGGIPPAAAFISRTAAWRTSRSAAPAASAGPPCRPAPDCAGASPAWPSGPAMAAAAAAPPGPPLGRPEDLPARPCWSYSRLCRRSSARGAATPSGPSRGPSSMHTSAACRAPSDAPEPRTQSS